MLAKKRRADIGFPSAILTYDSSRPLAAFPFISLLQAFGAKVGEPVKRRPHDLWIGVDDFSAMWTAKLLATICS